MAVASRPSEPLGRDAEQLMRLLGQHMKVCTAFAESGRFEMTDAGIICHECRECICVTLDVN